MSEPDTTETAEPDASDADGRVETDDGGEIRTYLYRGALVLLVLLAVLATIRFYLAASTAIDVWIADRYRPLFQAGFNLVVLLAAGVGISLVVRELAD